MTQSEVKALEQQLFKALYNYLSSLSLEELKKIPWLTSHTPPDYSEEELREINS